MNLNPKMDRVNNPTSEALDQKESGLVGEQQRITAELLETRRAKWQQEKSEGISILAILKERTLFVQEKDFYEVSTVCEAIRAKGYLIRDTAHDALNIIDIGTEQKEEQGIVLADISVEELGFKEEQVHYGDIRERALGSTITVENEQYIIESCKPKDSIAFTQNYKDASENEYWFRIASDTIEIPQGYGVIFRIVRGKDGIKRFDTEANGDKDDYLDDHTHLIFRLRKK